MNNLTKLASRFLSVISKEITDTDPDALSWEDVDPEFFDNEDEDYGNELKNNKFKISPSDAVISLILNEFWNLSEEEQNNLIKKLEKAKRTHSTV